MPDMTYTDSILINAPIGVVYAAVSDVTRMGEWSPICRKCWWDEGAGPWVGSLFTGRNIAGRRTWETRCEVVAADTNSAFGWSVADGAVYWTYTFEDLDGATRLTETWVFPGKGQALFAALYGDAAADEIALRERWAHEGIPATLAAVKRALERR